LRAAAERDTSLTSTRHAITTTPVADSSTRQTKRHIVRRWSVRASPDEQGDAAARCSFTLFDADTLFMLFMRKALITLVIRYWRSTT